MGFEETLQKVGLSEKEIKIYSTLLDSGEQKISSLLVKTDLKRGDLYYSLDNLVAKNLIVKEDKNKKLHFRLNHPNQLEKLLEQKEVEIKKAEAEVSAVMPTIISNFNLSHNQPGVKVFEGQNGFLRLMEDSLDSRTDILSYTDPQLVDKLIPKENRQYTARRLARRINKRILIADTVENRNRYQISANKFTEVRFIDPEVRGFATTIQIYDNKISYQNFKPGVLLGVVVEDEMIVKFERMLFEMIWKTAKPL